MKSQSMQFNILQAESNNSNKILMRSENVFIAQACRKQIHTREQWKKTLQEAPKHRDFNVSQGQTLPAS